MLDVLILVQEFFQFVAGKMGHLMFDVPQVVGELVQRRERQLRLVDDGVGGVENRVLGKMADAKALGDGGRSEVDGHLAKDDFEQRGLSAAVVADQADAFAAVDGEIQLVEDNAPAEGFLDVAEGNDGHNGKRLEVGIFRPEAIPHKITAMTMRLAIMLSLFLCGCARSNSTPRRQGSSGPIRVGNDRDVRLSDAPLQYRLRADEGHLIVWIENPTADSIELIRDQSQVVDQEGMAHPIRGRTIGPGSSVKEIFPPLAEPAESSPPGQPDQIDPYDRPGFISISDAASGGGPGNASWPWDDGMEIHVDLFFQQGGQAFEQHLVFRRVRG